MPPKHNKQAAPVRASGRRSGAVTQFLSLDLYSKGSFERSITTFDPNENHNGVPLDWGKSTVPAASSQVVPTPTSQVVPTPTSQVVPTPKKRRQSNATSASKKRTKRAVSAAPSDGSLSSRAASPAPSATTAVDVVAAAPASAKKRGRPPATRKAPIAASPKTPAKRTPKAAAKAKPPKKAKVTPKGRRGGDDDNEMTSTKKNRATTEGDDGENTVAAPKKAGRARQPRQSLAAVALMIKQEPPSSDDDENNHQNVRQAVSALRTAIDTALNGNQDLTSEQIDEAVSVLHEMCECASNVSAVDYTNMVENLKLVAIRIARKEPIPDVAALVRQLGVMEKASQDFEDERGEWKNKQKKEKEAAARKEQRLERQLALANTRATQANTRAITNHTKSIVLQAEKDALQAQVDQLTEQIARQNGGSRATASSSRSSRHGRIGRVGGGNDMPTGYIATSALVPVGMQPLQPAAPAPAPFDMSQMPRGSTVGHSQMAGRANDLISGLSNVSGLGDTLASVAVTAATMPEFDPDGNMVQRTIRTRVERIAVTDDMDVDELRRLGFAVVRLEASDNEEEEEGENARIEEVVEEEVVDGEEMMDDIEEEADEPVVEEAE